MFINECKWNQLFVDIHFKSINTVFRHVWPCLILITSNNFRCIWRMMLKRYLIYNATKMSFRVRTTLRWIQIAMILSLTTGLVVCLLTITMDVSKHHSKAAFRYRLCHQPPCKVNLVVKVYPKTEICLRIQTQENQIFPHPRWENHLRL